MIKRRERATPTPARGAAGDPARLPVLEHIWADTFPELSRPVTPAHPPAPQILALNDAVVHDLGWDPVALQTPPGVRFLTGDVGPHAHPVAQVYSGHQWGRYQPILGDGRAALLGEARDLTGAARDVHLKGIGPTSMSRVDGFAVVGPMLREYLMGEAMSALGVPTTRALAVVATGAPREHDGTISPGAVLARTATSHVRIGSVEYASATRDLALVRRLADYVIARHYPEADAAPERYAALLAAIVAALAQLTADWMRLGFVHGVLSTDNVLVGAETIDYGPCAFLDVYEPRASFSSIDLVGRYAYEKQPSIMRWNLEILGAALAPVLASDPHHGATIAAETVARFDEEYGAARREAFRRKLGLSAAVDSATLDRLTETALGLLAQHEVDFTGFWRDLAPAASGDDEKVRSRFPASIPELDVWLAQWRALGPDPALLRASNPIYIPRNHLVEEALQAATDGDLAPFEELLDLVSDPFTERQHARYARHTQPAPAGTPPHQTFCGT